MDQKIINGIDEFIQQIEVYKSKRIALVSNNVAKTSRGVSTRMALLKEGFELIKLFSPEHGLSARGEDGAFQKNGIDDLTRLPVISLYGDHFAPTEKDLDDIDLVLFDIPDVGCRFYTYLWTMTHVMESCARFNKLFILADRPNPVSGNLAMAEGPMLDEEHCSSFIGRWSIPIRHSCTLGELANYFAATRIKSLELKIFPVINWERNQMIAEQEFSPTSPAIENITTALLYPGMGLLEGINVNEGRGTDKPFRVCGSPWIDSVELKHAVERKNCEGISFHSISYKPNDGLYANEECKGLEFFITDINSFHPVATGLALLQTIVELYPEFVEERLYRTLANPEGTGHLDKMLGVKDSFQRIHYGKIFEAQMIEVWNKTVNTFLLY